MRRSPRPAARAVTPRAWMPARRPAPAPRARAASRPRRGSAPGGAGASPRRDLEASLSPGRVTSSAGGKPLVLLDYTGGDAHLHVDPKLATGHVGWKLTDGGNLTADVRLTGAQQALSGHIKGDM